MDAHSVSIAHLDGRALVMLVDLQVESFLPVRVEELLRGAVSFTQSDQVTKREDEFSTPFATDGEGPSRVATAAGLSPDPTAQCQLSMLPALLHGDLNGRNVWVAATGLGQRDDGGTPGGAATAARAGASVEPGRPPWRFLLLDWADAG
jgi:hypothetical protein